MRHLLVCAVLVHYVWGQGAPGDFDMSCRQTYPAGQVVLYDSNAYDTLYGSIWLLRAFDGGNQGWSQTGGVCTRSLATDLMGLLGRNSWVFSQFINYLDAREVIIRITYSFSTNNYVTVYHSNSNTELIEAQRIEQGRYRPFNGTDTNSRLTAATNQNEMVQWGFLKPVNTRGFYLAIQEQGAVVFSIQRILLYYRVAVQHTDGLLSCPDMPLPQLGGMAVGTCSCAANSAPVSGVSLDATCNYEGMCSGGQWCACLLGYQLQLQHNNQCIACPEGTFKHLHDNSSCLSCPTNSESRGSNNTVCACIPPNIRDPSDPTAPCTTPPSSPRLILGKDGLPIVSGDVTTVCWLPALDKGGLNDLRYNIYIFSVDTENPTYRRLNTAQGVVQQSSNDNMKVCYDAMITNVGLNYGLIVVSTNGATASIDGDMITDVEAVQGRSVAFFVAGSPACSSPSASVAGPVVATLFVTALVTAAVSVLITVLVMLFLCKSKGEKTNPTINDSYRMESKPPSKTPPIHEPDDMKVASHSAPAARRAPPKPAVAQGRPNPMKPPPPRPVPRHV